MKRVFCLLLSLVMLASVGAAVDMTASAASYETVTGAFYYDYSNEVINAVNKQREAKGLSKLKADKTLTEQAMLRAAELAVSFSHTRPNGQASTTVYTWTKAVGENIAWGQLTSAEVMQDWLNSDGHRANIFNTNYTKMGVGCFCSDGVMYWVQAFSGGSCSSYTPSGVKPVKVKVGLSSGAKTTVSENKSGSCGSNVKYSFDTDELTLTVSGSGKMKSYSSYYSNGALTTNAPWASYCIYIKKIVIKDGVTSIGDNAFYGCKNMTSAKISNTVKQIGKSAFAMCSSLKKVTYTGSKSQWNNAVSYSYSSVLDSVSVSCVGNCTLSFASCTYNGKSRKPVVTVKDGKGNKISSKYYTVTYVNQSTGKTVSSMKSAGKYYVKIKFKGSYSGTVKKSFKIKPPATSIKSVTAASKGFTVKWNKVTTQTTGYQVQYSASSDFSGKTTKTVSGNTNVSKKITGLTGGKKYYVRVRTYKTVKIDGKSTKIYSKWSDTKTVTAKK